MKNCTNDRKLILGSKTTHRWPCRALKIARRSLFSSIGRLTRTKYSNDGMSACITRTGSRESTVSDIYIIDTWKLRERCRLERESTVEVACSIERHSQEVNAMRVASKNRYINSVSGYHR